MPSPLSVMPAGPSAQSPILPAIASESPLPMTVMTTLLLSVTPTSEATVCPLPETLIAAALGPFRVSARRRPRRSW